MRDAIVRAVRFYRVISHRSALAFTESAAVATVRRERTSGGTPGAILTELPFASLALRARAATEGQFAIRAARFRHVQSPALAPAYAEVFGRHVSFGASADELDIDPLQLDLRLASADPITSAALEAVVARLAETHGRDPLLDRVRRAAAPHLSGEIALEPLARELGMSTRSLRRHLHDSGSSLRAIIDELRRERAEQLLAAGAPIKQIAFDLGFSETSAFSRAYKRWTGSSPRLGK